MKNMEPDISQELDKQVKRNRIKNIEKNADTGRDYSWLYSWTKKKAVLFPLAIFLVLSIIGGSIYFFKKYKSVQSSDLANKKNPQSHRSLPELPSNNRDLAEGKSYYLKGWYPAAQSSFERVINSDASDNDKAVALTYLGMIAYDQEQYVRAIDFFKRALKYNDKDVIIFRNLSLVYRRRGMMQQALDYARQAVKMQPENSKNYLLMGNIYFDLKNYNEAIKQYSKGLKFSVDDPLLFYNLGLAQMQKGDIPAAVNSFELSAHKAQIGRVALAAWRNLAHIYSIRRDWKKAISYLQSAVKIAPKNSELYFELGNIYLAAGMRKEALEQYEKALLVGRPSRALYEKLGDTYSEMKLFGPGIKAYTQALKNGNPGNIPVIAKLAELYYKQGDLKKAEEMNRKIIALSPGSNDSRIAYINLGNILHDVEQYDQAVEMYRKAADLDPTDDKPWINMALSYRAGKQYGRAIKAFKKAIVVNPDSIKPRLGLGRLYTDQGFFNEALETFLQILQVKPDNAMAHFQIAQLYHKKMAYGEAVSGYRKVIQIKPKNQELVYKSHLNLAIILGSKQKIKDPMLSEQTYEQAITHAKIAIQMKLDQPDGYLILGEIYLARKDVGDVQNAIERFRQVIAMNRVPARTLSRTCNNLGKAYFHLGKYSLAIRQFSKALEYWPGNEEAALNRKTAALRYENSLRQ